MGAAGIAQKSLRGEKNVIEADFARDTIDLCRQPQLGVQSNEMTFINLRQPEGSACELSHRSTEASAPDEEWFWV